MQAFASKSWFRALPALAALALLTGCATRYDSNGNKIYFMQFGQETYNAIDYSNPRLPVLPRSRPTEFLWPTPSPYEFQDLSRYSQVTPSEPLTSVIAAVSDNATCAASCESNATGALVASRADARDDSQSFARH